MLEVQSHVPFVSHNRGHAGPFAGETPILDPQDLGAQIREDHGTIRSRKKAGKIQNFDPLQSSHCNL